MRTYATAQLIGDRTTQCDATAVYTAPSGARDWEDPAPISRCPYCHSTDGHHVQCPHF